MKYKPKAQIKATNIEETENTEKPTYAEILRKSRNPSPRQNLTTNLESNTKPNKHGRLQSMSATNKYRKQGKSLSRSFTKTSNANADKQQQKLNELEEEISKLKATQNIAAKTTKTDQTKMNNPPHQYSKNGSATSATSRRQQENTDLLKVISFVEETMKTLSNYGEQFKIQLDFNLVQSGNVISLSTRTFNRDVFKLLNKN